MDNPSDPNANRKGSVPGVVWLLVGLAPIPILLALGSAQPRPHRGAGYIIILCVFCNLAGGIGCLTGVKDGVVRAFAGLLLGGFFFLLTLGVALFQACSHMNF